MAFSKFASFVLPALCVFARPCFAQSGAPAGLDEDRAVSLEAWVESYLRHPSAKARYSKLHKIEVAVGQDVAAVARALRSAKLWKMPDSRDGEFSVILSGEPHTFAYSLPDGYRPDVAFPLLVFWSPALDALDQLHALRGKSTDALKGFVLVSP